MKGIRLGFTSGALLLIMLWGGKAYTRGCQLTNLLILDTSERESFLYKPIIDRLETVGFNVTYKSLDSVIDQSSEVLGLEHYKAVFFIFGTDFLSGLYRSHLCLKVLRLLHSYARRPGVLIGLICPSLRAGPGINVLSHCAPIFDQLGFKTPRQELTFPVEDNSDLGSYDKKLRSVSAFCYIANMFLSMPIETRPLMYHTTLNFPHQGMTFDLDQIESVLQAGQHPLFFLPLFRQASETIQATFPYGLYWFNPIYHNHIFITTASVLTFSGMAENFHLCPLDFRLRAEMLDMVARMMWEICILVRSKHEQAVKQGAALMKRLPADIIAQHHTPREAMMVFGTGPMHERQSPHADRKIAWMEIAAFETLSQEELTKNPDAEHERTMQQNALIDYIMRSGLDSLWITINPHMYYSPIARCAGQEKEQKFLQALSLFTSKLQQAAQNYNRAVPKILVGIEITNNLYEPNLPQYYPVDVYENAYQDLPIPVARSFWHQEVTKPLEVFVKKWQNPEISHGIPLSGVVLDLEMYCRKKTGSFLTTMSFDARTFSKFMRVMKNQENLMALRDRVLWLMQHQSGRHYFHYLEQQAEAIGRDLQQRFTQNIPDGAVMCYMPNLPVAWFYKGLCKGLSDKKRPLQLLTFNSEYFAHEQWFTRNHIYTSHATVLMLSKLKDEQSFEWVDYLLKHHHGIWLNRFSRFIEPQTREWMSIEQPSMDQGLYEAFMDYLNSK